MLVPKKNRLAVYSELFKDGVMVAEKNFSKKVHEAFEEDKVPNLHVMKLMQSLKSRGYVRETFNWQWNYWYLTDEGIEYLREYLHLPSDIVPNTHKKSNVGRSRQANEGGEFSSAKDTVGHDFRPNFAGEGQQGGFGRGGGGF